MQNLLLQTWLAEQLRGSVKADEHAWHPLGSHWQKAVRITLEVYKLCKVRVLYECLEKKGFSLIGECFVQN